MSAAELEQAIKSVDDLNSWVRSESYRGNSGILSSSPRKAIYYLKRCAILEAHKAGLAAHRYVYTILDCNRCDGKGNYYGWWWEPGMTPDLCRNCKNGKAELRFIETTIETGVRWHTPLYKGFPWIPGSLSESEITKGDPAWTTWLPNTRGRNLLPVDVATRLNTAEEFFAQHLRLSCVSRTAFNDIFKYHLWIGETERHVCSLCRCPNSATHAYCVVREGLCWRDFSCQECADKHDRQSAKIFDEFPVPINLIEHPEIQRWIERARARSCEA